MDVNVSSIFYVSEVFYMGNYPTLSDSDYAVMEILWRDKEAKSSEICKELEKTFGWSRQTVGTYLKRLVNKNLVGTKSTNNRDYLYFPIVSKQEYGTDVTSGYLDKYFGSLSHMVAGIMRKEDISQDEIDALEKVIAEYKAGKGGENDD